jgi:hypothetical protein
MPNGILEKGNRFGPRTHYNEVTASTDLPDDEAAIKWGAALLTADRPCAAIEVWQLARRVCRLQRAD